jgi:hypothetical protein
LWLQIRDLRTRIFGAAGAWASPSSWAKTVVASMMQIKAADRLLVCRIFICDER